MKERPMIVISGLPGKMATLVGETISKRETYKVDGLDLSANALTGPNQPRFCPGKVCDVSLAPPRSHESLLNSLLAIDDTAIIIVDYTQPNVVNRNAELYCKVGIPFVMGTTGGNRKALERVVQDSGNTAVIAPNMAKQIVTFQAMMDYAANTFPGAFKDYTLEITESHQKGKKDTSETAKVMVSYFNKLGVPFTKDQIKMIRKPGDQLEIGVPEEALTGHGWHTYTLKSKGDNVLFQFTHNINGRQPYADGTIDAIKFLHKKLADPKSKGKVYSMIDVLKEGS